ncbi:PEP-CTERM sorting domain-containing protein [Methylicorpusculum oleiharenae]|uniref:PEP-CTERM sorting domain-containing protein n=1 Tax=Methylicorpusculum oleiharenae TaxID=1338687 RepID=UPI00135C89DE|nr:PEP-CTERM sorting domain-containing protein [Methylicorpusculum oleiharenae]MCD2451855.1 PEP-CTERM sorting domain-containing protein [Methylicorpusculum oleiharenae]
MNIVGKTLAVTVMGLAATGAQATIKGGVTTASTELVFNLWNEASEISYALDLGVIHNDFLDTKTEAKSWSIDAKTSTAFAAFLAATQPEQTLVYNIASSNGSLTGGLAALPYYGLLRTSNDANISKVTTTAINNTAGKINNRAIKLNTQLNVSGGDISNNFDSVSGKADVGYFGTSWGDNMDGSTGFGTVGLEGEGNTLGFYWQNREFASLGLTGIEKLADWTFVIDFDTKTAALNYGAPAVVPVPAAVWLFGTGLMGLFAAKRRKALTA